MLTPREKEVIPLLARGLLIKEIADELGISLNTAKLHSCNIYRKLGVNNKTELSVKYLLDTLQSCLGRGK